MPEAITRRDGARKNDRERNAAKRLLRRVREDQPKLEFVVVGDGLASDGPRIEWLEAPDTRHLLGVKPGDRAKPLEQVRAALHAERCHELAIIDGPDRERGYRWISGLTLDASRPDRKVNCPEHRQITDGRERIWSRVTDLPPSAETVEAFARAGRARWKAENETSSTLKNRGHHLEHNHGHGRQHLSAVFARLMRLAFLVDRVQEASCRLLQAARDRFRARIALRERSRNPFIDFDIPDWATLWAALIRGHDKVTLIPAAPDTSWSRQAARESELTRMLHPRPGRTRTPPARSMSLDRASRRGLWFCATPAGENTAEIRLRAGIAVIVMSDALAANQRDGDDTLIRCHCLAHGRRQSTDLDEAFPAEAHHVIAVLNRVFEHEAVTRDRAMSAAERLAYHQTRSGPLLEGLRDWLERQFQDRRVEPNGSLGKAFTCLLARWETLTQFMRVEGAPLDSNAVGRALKPIIRQRKNSLFYASAHGARVASILTSLIATCAQAGVNALEYLVALQVHRSAVFRRPAAWLPWNYRANLAPA